MATLTSNEVRAEFVNYMLNNPSAVRQWKLMAENVACDLSDWEEIGSSDFSIHAEYILKDMRLPSEWEDEAYRYARNLLNNALNKMEVA